MYALPFLRGCWANLTFEHLLHLITTAHSLLTFLLTGLIDHTFLTVILLSSTHPKPLLQKEDIFLNQPPLLFLRAIFLLANRSPSCNPSPKIRRQ